MCHRQTVKVSKLSCQVSHLNISKKVVDPELNLEGNLLQYLPILNVDPLKLLFVFYHLEN